MTKRTLSVAISPCPNDTVQFSAIAGGELSLPGAELDIHLLDIEQLNRAAEAQAFDIVKVSSATWLRVRRHYTLLDTGAALGYGCGPLLLSTRPRPLGTLGQCRVAFPGERTTAHLLFRLLAVPVGEAVFTRYDEIVQLLAEGRVDCGVIIHESRFTYAAAGLHCLLDLGQWWESETGLPIPLGCFVMHKRFGAGERAAVEALMRKSLALSLSQPVESDDFVRRHAHELEAGALKQHIGLYVNDFTRSLGELGRGALDALAIRAEALVLAA
jgi:1,4-dihydroxy-6-naphthoate synthase